MSGIPLLQCGWLEGCITTIPFFSRKNISDQVTARIFQQCKCIVIFVNLLSPSDDFSVATPDETNGQESEFSLVVNLRNEIIKTVKFSVLSQFQKSF